MIPYPPLLSCDGDAVWFPIIIKGVPFGPLLHEIPPGFSEPVSLAIVLDGIHPPVGIYNLPPTAYHARVQFAVERLVVGPLLGSDVLLSTPVLWRQPRPK